MVATSDITEFSKGEGVALQVLLKNRDGTALSSAATQDVDFVIYDNSSGAIIVEWSSSPQVVLADAGTADWSITLSRTDLALVLFGDCYSYGIWSTSASDERLHQLTGEFNLSQAVSPT